MNARLRADRQTHQCQRQPLDRQLPSARGCLGHLWCSTSHGPTRVAVMALAVAPAKHGRSEMRACCCAMLCRGGLREKEEKRRCRERSGQDHGDQDSDSDFPQPSSSRSRPAKSSRVSSGPSPSLSQVRIGRLFAGRGDTDTHHMHTPTTIKGAAEQRARSGGREGGLGIASSPKSREATSAAANRRPFLCSHGSPTAHAHRRIGQRDSPTEANRGRTGGGVRGPDWIERDGGQERHVTALAMRAAGSQSLTNPCRVHSARR